TPLQSILHCSLSIELSWFRSYGLYIMSEARQPVCLNLHAVICYCWDVIIADRKWRLAISALARRDDAASQSAIRIDWAQTVFALRVKLGQAHHRVAVLIRGSHGRDASWYADPMKVTIRYCNS